jgi:2-phosphosulfolactate phosphatase
MTTSEQKHMVHVWLALGVDGARQGADRRDVVVIVDALRASATVVVALHVGARRVIPVLSVQEANAYLHDPDYRVAGERGGARPSQFHFGNSPSEILKHRADIAGRLLILTTSNGTRCMNAALPRAAGVLVGSVGNAAAVAGAALAMARHRGRGITLVAAGLEGQPTDEDTFSAALLAGRLAGAGIALSTEIPQIREADSLKVFLSSKPASRLTALGYGEDIRLCAQVDLWSAVPVYADGGFVAYVEGAEGFV